MEICLATNPGFVIIATVKGQDEMEQTKPTKGDTKMTKYTATFSMGQFTRNSLHAYKTAALAVKDGIAYRRPTFSAGVARANLPGDSDRRAAKCYCYNEREKAQLRASAENADRGYIVEVVNVEAH